MPGKPKDSPLVERITSKDDELDEARAKADAARPDPSPTTAPSRTSIDSDSERTATLEAEGRETTGPGSARAKAHMSVLPEGAGSVVKIVTDYSVAGRVAQFGRGVMEDVSRRIVNEMAACIKSNVEAAEPGGGA